MTTKVILKCAVSLRLSDFRVLIPSWLFFDDVDEGFEVWVRMPTSISDLGEWMPALAPAPRGVLQLFHNPQGNLRLYQLSCFERLLSESQNFLENPALFAQHPSYRLGLEIFKDAYPEARRFQFRIRSKAADAFISSVHEREP